jgi:hypothetical protein
MESLRDTMSGYKWITALPQLASRICHQNAAVHTILIVRDARASMTVTAAFGSLRSRAVAMAHAGYSELNSVDVHRAVHVVLGGTGELERWVRSRAGQQLV